MLLSGKPKHTSSLARTSRRASSSCRSSRRCLTASSASSRAAAWPRYSSAPAEGRGWLASALLRLELVVAVADDLQERVPFGAPFALLGDKACLQAPLIG